MVDYVFSNEGHQFLQDALRTCNRCRISWEQLWSRHVHEADEAREALGVQLNDGKDPPGEAAKILGAYTVIHMLQEIAANRQDPVEAINLLVGADLLTEQNIQVAAELFKVTPTDIWYVFGAESE